MSRNSRYAVAAAAAIVLVATTYVMSGNSTAYSYSAPTATSRIDVLAIMVGAKDLPSEQFDLS